MSKLLLRNVFIGGIGVVAASAGAMTPGSSSPAKATDANFVHKAGANSGWPRTSASNRHERNRRRA